MMRMIRPLALVALAAAAALVLAAGLVNADSRSAGATRSVPEFHAIDLAGTLEVEVTAGKPVSVELTGDADLLDKVITTVKNGVLVIDTKFPPHDRHGHHHLKALVTAPDLTSIAISGTGAMKVTGIANDRLSISVPGTGSVTAAGSTGALHVVVDGTGEVAAKQLAAKDTTVEVSGTGSATLRATQSLDATITGTGSIDVHGHPARVKKAVTGLGSIHIDR
jgi:hypothetical protein